MEGERLVLQRPDLTVVRAAFSSAIPQTVTELEVAMRSYSPVHLRLFHALESLVEGDAAKNEAAPGHAFWSATLPAIVDWATRLEELCPEPVPILARGTPGVVALSSAQATSLLCNMFLCTFPLPDDGSGLELPFCHHFGFLLHERHPQEVAKLAMFLRFFRGVAASGAPPGRLFVRRCSLPEAEVNDARFSSSEAPVLPLEVAGGRIEDAQSGHLQVDFANRFIGGGVLCGGCVQEEIRFAVCPLLTVSLLLCEAMGPHEAIRLTGGEQFSAYSGYAFGLRDGGPHTDTTERDGDGTVRTCLTAIDAIPYGHGVGLAKQYERASMLRDTAKAFVGFAASDGEEECSRERYPNIATGNWGCGAFGGDLHLKSILQWIAASEAGRRMRYYSFGEGGDTFAEDLTALSHECAGNGVTVGQLWRWTTAFDPKGGLSVRGHIRGCLTQAEP